MVRNTGRTRKHIVISTTFTEWFEERFPDVALSFIIIPLLHQFYELSQSNPDWSCEHLISELTNE